ncbi:NB-ARC domain-containing protein [Streptomyces lincolnensis]|uniref:NB-ARC domain-containing protein n=1 Tax=Streptomyces lincolnensis TaxID=1915 RepID=UPI0037CDADAF
MVRSSSGSHRAASSARAAVPAPPPHHIERTAYLDTARRLLLPGQKPSGTAVVGLVGAAGSGKSTLARAVATDAAVTAHFEQVLWIEADPGADPVDYQHRVSAALGDTRPVPDVASGMERLSELLADGRRLIVLDGVERREQWDAVDLSGLCSLLVTSRDHDILHGRGEVYEIRLLDARSCDRLFTAWAGPRDKNPWSGGTSFAVVSAGLPLSLACAGALVAHGWSPHHTHMRLGSAGLSRLRADTPRAHPDDSRAYLMAALDVALSELDDSLLERYLSLAVFEARGPVPVEAAALLWRSTGERGSRDTAPQDMPAGEVLDSLARRALLRPDPETRRFTLDAPQFDHMREFLGPQDLRTLHHDLATALLDRWGGLGRGLPGTAGEDFGDDPVDGYGLERVVGHLVAAGDHDEVHTLLALEGRPVEGGPPGTSATPPAAPEPGNLWFAVQERADGTADWLRDLELARRLAENATADGGTPQIALEVRYALMRGSVSSLTAALPVPLLPALVEQGVWTSARALAYARTTFTRPAARADAFEALLPVLPAPTRSRIAQELAGAAVSNPEFGETGRRLARLQGELTDRERLDFVRRALRKMLAADYRTRPAREREMLHLAALLPEDMPEEILALALESARQPYANGGHDVANETAALTALAERASGERRDRYLAEALSAVRAIEAPHPRTTALCAIAALQQAGAREHTLKLALRAARKERSGYWRADALTSVARLLPEPRRGRLLAQVLDKARRDTDGPGPVPLAAVAPHLPEQMLPEALEAARRLTDPGARCAVLLGIEQRMAEANLADGATVPDRTAVAAEALAAARETPVADGERARALCRVAGRLPEERRRAVVVEALASARVVTDQGRLAPAYAALAAHLPPHDSAEFTGRALALARALPPDRRLPTLHLLLPHLSRPRSTEVAEEMIALAMRDAAATHLMARIAPDLPAESARRATDLTLRLRPDTRPERIARVVALAHLTPYLPEDGLVEPIAGQLVTAHVGILLPALRKMAPRMSPGVLHRTIGRAEEHHDDEDMMLVMAVLAPWMTGEGRAVLEFLPGAARLRPDARFRCRLLTLVAENLPAAAAAPLLAEAWSQARLISGPETRADALTALARLLPEPRRTEVFHEASTAAAAVEGLADRAATAARIARTVAETRTVDTAWRDFGRPALRLAALLGRAAVAEQLAHPSSGDVLGTAAQDIARALHDVTRWWP